MLFWNIDCPDYFIKLIFLKIWAAGQGGVHSPPHSLIIHEESWGVGQNVITAFFNKEGEERATHTQKTMQTGQ